MKNQRDQLLEFKEILETSQNIVFFGGAGVSTESGIPDFRSEDGVFKALKDYGRPVEDLLSRSFFHENPETFFDYYKKFLVHPEAKPNSAHKALAELEAKGKLRAVVTQNIDGLHQKAGSKKVYELHGSILRNYCMKCGKAYDLDFILQAHSIPRCEACKGIVKPDVVLYEEALDGQVMGMSLDAIERADTLIIGGTSLAVYPAAGLVDYFRGKNLILINKSAPAKETKASLVINQAIGQVFKEVMGW